MSGPDGYELKTTKQDVRTVHWSDVIGDEATLRALLPAEQCNRLFKVLTEASQPAARLIADNQQLSAELAESGPAPIQRPKRTKEEEEDEEDEWATEEAEERKKAKAQDVDVQSPDVEQATRGDQDMQE